MSLQALSITVQQTSYLTGLYLTKQIRLLFIWHLRLIHTSVDSAVDVCVVPQRLKNSYLCIDTVHCGIRCGKCEWAFTLKFVFSDQICEQFQGWNSEKE